MSKSRFSKRHRQLAAQKSRASGVNGGSADVLLRKEAVCAELIRIAAVIEKLRHRRRIAPDVSNEDLLEIFSEESERLFSQLRQLDALLMDGEDENGDPVSYSRVIELRRKAIASGTALDFR
jgi:hypothetical protein